MWFTLYTNTHLNWVLIQLCLSVSVWLEKYSCHIFTCLQLYLLYFIACGLVMKLCPPIVLCAALCDPGGSCGPGTSAQVVKVLWLVTRKYVTSINDIISKWLNDTNLSWKFGSSQNIKHYSNVLVNSEFKWTRGGKLFNHKSKRPLNQTKFSFYDRKTMLNTIIIFLVFYEKAMPE